MLYRYVSFTQGSNMSSSKHKEESHSSDLQVGEPKGHRSETRAMSPMVYELFVLGELMVQPAYGYKLHEHASRILGPWRPLSWGILYPLIRRLEREGLTTSTVERRRGGFPAEERGQPRRIYSITEAGRQRFLDFMLNDEEYSRDTPELFLIKLTKLQFLSPAQHIKVVQWYRRYISELHTYYQERRQEVLSSPEITEKERPYFIQLLDYQHHTLQAQLSWLDNVIALGKIAQLTVRGCKSGKPRTTPIGVVTCRGNRYLVATFGVVNWVHNLRAAQQATLICDRQVETISAVELPPEEAAPILKECLASCSGIARLCFKATPASPLDEFEREVAEHPVFQVRSL
jgi:deazaflavin-dependent oxidoreductase (nitroreductase family)